MKHSTRLYLRLTPEEKAKLAARAAALHPTYSLASFARELLTTGKVQPVPAVNLAQWTKLAGLMNNLNQLARLAHQGTTVNPDLIPLLQEISAMVGDIRNEIIRPQ